MTDRGKKRCYDMKLFILEWLVLNPEAGSGIKYISNLNKADLIKVCLYINGKISKDVLMEVIIARQNYFKGIYAKKKEIE